MPADRRSDRFGFWWLLATMLGFSGGAALAVLITQTIDQALVFAGLLGGLAQWLVLRRRLAKADWWLLATSLGVLLGAGLGLLCLVFGPWGSGMALALAVAGAVLGLLQWLVLAGQVKGAGFWIIATMLGYILGGLIGLAVCQLPTLQALGAVGSATAMAMSLSSTVGMMTGYWLNAALE